jgi:hypothetical protein
VDCPTSSLCLLVDGTDVNSSRAGGALYYATSLGGAWLRAYNPVFGVDAVSCASTAFSVDGQDGGGFFRYSSDPTSASWNLQEQGSSAMSSVLCLSSSFCAMVDHEGTIHVASTTSQMECDSWASTNVDGAGALNGIACPSTKACVAVDSEGNVLTLTIGNSGDATGVKHDIDTTHDLTSITCRTDSVCVSVDDQGNVFVSTNKGSSWVKYYTRGNNLTSVSCASGSLCVATDTSGEVTSFEG